MNRIWLILLVLVSGCAGVCMRVDGSYKDFDGGIEYCFDTQKSKDLGVPVIDENSNTFFGFDLEQINKIVDKLKDKMGIKTEKTKHPVTELLEILKEQ